MSCHLTGFNWKHECVCNLFPCVHVGGHFPLELWSRNMPTGVEKRTEVTGCALFILQIGGISENSMTSIKYPVDTSIPIACWNYLQFTNCKLISGDISFYYAFWVIIVNSYSNKGGVIWWNCKHPLCTIFYRISTCKTTEKLLLCWLAEQLVHHWFHAISE